MNTADEAVFYTGRCQILFYLAVFRPLVLMIIIVIQAEVLPMMKSGSGCRVACERDQLFSR